MQHCLALGASGAQAVSGIHLGLSALYHSAQCTRCGTLFKGTFMYVSQSPVPLCYSNNVSRHVKENVAVLLGAISGQAEAPSKDAPYMVTSTLMHLQ